MGNRVEGLDKVDGYGNNTLSVISVILIRAIQQEWPFKKPDRLEEKCGDMAVYIWSNKTFSYTLDITGRIEMDDDLTSHSHVLFYEGVSRFLISIPSDMNGY